MLTRVMEISAKQLLEAGVTTAVDLGAPLAESLSVRDRINKGEIRRPADVDERSVDHAAAGGGDDRAGFGGLTITTPRAGGAGGGEAGQGRRRS